MRNLFPLVAIFLLGPIAFATEISKSEPPADTRLYREIYATPQELIEALYSPLDPRDLPREKSATPSRMEKYFRVKEKKISGEQVSFVLESKVAGPAKLLAKSSKVAVTLNRLGGKESRKFSLSAVAPMQSFGGTLEFSPSKSGSLAILDLKESSGGNLALWAFRKFALSLGLATEGEKAIQEAKP